MSSSPFTHFLVLDFQATCEMHSRPQPEPREIIEISVAKIESKTFKVEALFHQYVRPRVHSKLSKFCIQLTGVNQCMVDDQPHLEVALQKLHSWLHEQGLFKPGVRFATVTHYDWLLEELLPKNCLDTAQEAALPDYLTMWISLTKEFERRKGQDPTEELDPLGAMLKTFRLAVEGPRHCGPFVCYNAARLFKALADMPQKAAFTIRSR